MLNSYKGCCSGFSLLELLLVLVFAAALLSTAGPHFSYQYDHFRLLVVARQLMQEIHFARSEAIRRNQSVCYRINQSSKSWADSRVVLAPNGEVIHLFGALPQAYKLILKNSLGCNDSLHFLPFGFTNEQRGSFYLSSKKETLRIVFGLSGRPYLCNHPI